MRVWAGPCAMRWSAACACARLASGVRVTKALSAGLKRCARSMKSRVSSWLEISFRASAADSSVRLALIIVRRET